MSWPTVPLADVLTFAGTPVRIREPAAETFVTVKMNCGGAVRRNIKDGKTPVAFTGYRLRPSQFIYSRIDARNGAFALVPSDLEGAVVSKDFPIFDVRSELVDASYLVHYLRAGRLQDQIRASSTGATNRQRITEDRFLSFRIPLPPLDEQKRLTAILDQADMLRSKRRSVIAGLESLSQAAFHDMFGDIGSSSNGYPTRPLEEWVDAARPITYGILKPGDDIDGGVPYVRVADMKNGGIELAGVRRTTPSIADSYRRSQLVTGDLLVSIRGHVGRFAFVPPELEGGNITQDSARLAVVEPSSARFVRAALETPYLQRWMARRTKGAAVRGINLGDLRRVPIPSPSDSEQRAFAAVARKVSLILDAAFQDRRALDELFASLQSRAFSGQL